MKSLVAVEAPAVFIAVAFIVSVALVPLLVRFAISRDLPDGPNARSSHEVPTLGLVR